MKPEMLDSQFAALEGPEEGHFNISARPEEVVREITKRLSL
jgi:gluconate kinase